jgi:hypothetical protein
LPVATTVLVQGTFNWWMRLLTGLLAAWGVAFLAFPWLDHLFQHDGTK